MSSKSGGAKVRVDHSPLRNQLKSGISDLIPSRVYAVRYNLEGLNAMLNIISGFVKSLTLPRSVAWDIGFNVTVDVRYAFPCGLVSSAGTRYIGG